MQKDLEKGTIGIKTAIVAGIFVCGVAISLIVSDRLAAKDIETIDKRVSSLEATSKATSDAIIRIDNNLQILLPGYKK